ncbi:DUF4870 domain-containing protein [Croceivirga thetidis]|uniref:DUF4870 domain-containing protein n=1 Tax=Croceivirga thetidis TaxID=2721623 RepID=A0ABX1GS65_9FLAO|nr:DUF4870 domain-containing protein [Croceivirga thetidis]NKI32783.1 DUF4870 domain-containing protein [Croceivirga thetidis]
MSTTLSKYERNLSATIHASTFSKYFVPFGNFIFPLILWMANKNQNEFVDYNGKQALNFQISLLLYTLCIGIIGVPFFIGFFPDIFDGNYWSLNQLDHLNDFSFRIDGDNFHFGSWIWPVGIVGLLKFALTIINVVYSILATIRTNEGERFEYPLTIKFIK